MNLNKNLLISYICVGGACIGSYVLGRIDGFRKGQTIAYRSITNDLNNIITKEAFKTKNNESSNKTKK